MKLIPLSRKFLFWLLGFTLSASSFIGCKCVKSTLQGPENPKPFSVNFLLNSYVSDADIKARLIDAVDEAGGTIAADSIVIRRCPCDSTLINITLPNSYTIEGQGPLAVKPGGGGGAASGGIDLPVQKGSVGFNYTIDVFEPTDPKISRPASLSPLNVYISQQNKDAGKTVAVAVFDSGLDESYLPELNRKHTVNLCNIAGIPSNTSEKGWNFVGGSGGFSDTGDNNIGKHGSGVAHLVVRQSNSSPTIVKIVPMKVLGADNKGDVFGLMCAMETARRNNIPIFNMSLGYYGEPDSLLRQYIKKATDQGIWIVTAAGNKPQNESPDSTRNLANMQKKFYPASFSEFDRVLAVSTAHLNSSVLSACIGQNYSPSLVLGVVPNFVATVDSCRFVLENSSVSVVGTSFASPILAGWLATQINQPGGLQNRSTVIGAMTQATGGTTLYQNKYIQAVP
ncbi:S8 family peptidase [Spirosoma sp. KNUC1025]|uniref:S8 family peptidase n=1 Tax=Spirosoma sp. KNUC1025 TaxID=2894082 RepID=UPI00386721B2|nr:S8 family serine peptidase [Spirosoma sp. KNUC1025]